MKNSTSDLFYRSKNIRRNIFNSPDRCSLIRFNIQQTQQILTSQSGLALIGSLLEKSNYRFELDVLPMPADRGAALKNSDIAVSMIGLLSRGQCDLDIELFRKDHFFPLALNLSRTPSAAILRQRLDGASGKWDAAARRATVKLLKNQAVQKQPH